MLSDGICHDVSWMRHIFFACLQSHLVYLAWPSQSNQSTSGDLRVAPVCKAHAPVYPGLDGQRMAGPCEKSISLCDHPVDGAVEIDDNE